MTEKIRPEHGWLVSGQKTWARHHNAWWVQPSVSDLARAYGKARTSARTMRKAAAAAGEKWSTDAMRDAWKLALDHPARAADHARIFKGAYASGKWGEGSGPGSNPVNCVPYIGMIEWYLQEHSICSVLDLGCGDGRLARSIEWSTECVNAALCGNSVGHREPVTYTGLDVVTGHDIRTCNLPSADLVLIKDVFQHWPNADIEAMLPWLTAYPHVLITNTISEQITGRPVNAEIAAGHWRAIDLAAPPFSWPVEELLRWELPGEVKSVVRLVLPASA